MPIQQNNLQQQSVLASLSSVDHVAENIKAEFLRKSEETAKTEPTESITKQLLEGTGRDAGKTVLAGLLSKLGETFTSKKISNKLQKDYDLLSESKDEDFSDKVDLKSLQSQRTKSAKNKASLNLKDEGSSGRNSELREYMRTYTQFLLNGGTEVKKKLEKLEQKLLREGELKLKTLNQHRSEAAKAVREEVLKQLKNAYYKQLFSQGKLEEALSRYGIRKIADWACLNEKIGGKEFGGRHGNLNGATAEAARQVKEEGKGFLQEELTQALIKKHLADGKGTEKEIGELLKAAQKCGLDVEGFIKKMPKLMDDLGLLPVVQYEVAPQNSMDQGKEERKEYQYDPDEEKDILMERIRIYHMQMAIFGDWKTRTELAVKMFRDTRGLVKLGLKMEDFSKKLENEGKKLAGLKLVQMLREAFEERATYAKLQGPAWQMTEKKIKTILKNLVKLRIELSDKDVEYMKDEANRKMFAEAEHEFRLIETALEARQTAYLAQKRKTALQILDRLSEESNIPWDKEQISKITIAT